MLLFIVYWCYYLQSAGASKQQQKKGETLEKGKPVKGGNNKKSAGQFGSDANKPLNKKTGVKNVAFSNITEIGSVKIEGNLLCDVSKSLNCRLYRDLKACYLFQNRCQVVFLQVILIILYFYE